MKYYHSMKQTHQFKLAYRFINETYLNVFLTGKAGTGKTTFLKYLRDNSHKSIVVAAPTGVAAINAQGVTLHSLFQLPFTPYIPGSFATDNTLRNHPVLSKIKFNKEKLRILRNMDVLVIDEVSMVASNTLDSIDAILKGVRRDYTSPFGGVQVLFIGDMHQLPPVVKRDSWDILKSIYPSFYFFDSQVLREYPPVIVEFTQIFRQKQGHFVEILNAVRNNQLNKEQLELLNTRIDRSFKSADGYITLSTHNNQADSINQVKIAEIKSEEFIYSAHVKGDFPENMYPVDHDLLLKKGAQVMFVKNDVEDKKYFNGKIGTIVFLDKSEIVVQCEGDKEAIKVKKEKWENVNYKVDAVTREVDEDVLGSFEQFPLRLAWAITIHKSQGLTFEKLIVDAERAFANGQVYVALSRCTSLEGLVLTSPISQRFLGASENLTKWNSEHNHPEKLDQKLEDSRIDTIRYEMIHAFDWSKWITVIQDLDTYFKDLADKLTPEVKNWLRELFVSAQESYKVSKSFQMNLLKIVQDERFAQDQSDLIKRLKDAAVYFIPRIEEWKVQFYSHGFQVKTKSAASIFDEFSEEIALFLHDLQFRLQYFMKHDFELSHYLEEGKVNKTKHTKVSTAYQTKTSKALTAAKDIKHIQLYQQLAAYRKELADESSVPIYRIFTNSTIKNICNHLPTSENELLTVGGIGSIKIKQFGEAILEIVNCYLDDNPQPQTDLFN
jgi:hypothetical protein